MSDISARIGIEGGREAVKALQDVGKEAQKLDGTTAKVKVGLDDKAAKKSIDDILTKVEKLDSKSAQMLIKSNADQMANDIAGLILKIDQLDANDPLVDVEVANLAQLQGDIDTLDAKFKELDAQKVVVDVDTTGATEGIGKLRDSSDQTRSVMANLVGNTAQDLGALGGAAGSAGVAVGQLAEYAADGNVSLGGLAKLAGPMLGLAAAGAIVVSHFKNIADTKAFNKERVKEFNEALEDAVVTAEELRDVVSGKDAPDSIMARITGDTKDVEDQVQRTLGTFEEFNRIVQGGQGELDRWVTTQLRVAAAAGASEEELATLAAAYRHATTETTTNYAIGQARAMGYSDEIITAYALGQAVTQLGDAESESASDAEFYGTAADGATEAIERQRKTTLDALRAQEEYNVQLREAQAAIDDLVSPLRRMERLHGALSDVFDMGNAPLDALGDIQDIEQGIRDFAEYVKGDELKGAIPDIFNPDDVHADDFLAKIEGLRGPIQEQISLAFASGGPVAAQQTADSYVNGIVEALGGALTKEQVISLLGLSDLQAQIDVALNQAAVAQVQSQLDLLVGLKGQTPYTASIALALATGTITPEAAEILVQSALEGAGVLIPNALDTPDTEAARREAAAFAQEFGIVIPLGVGPMPPIVPPEVPPVVIEGDTTSAEEAISDIETGDYGASVTTDADIKLAAATLLALRLAIARSQSDVQIGADTTSATGTVNSFTQRKYGTEVKVNADDGQAERDINHTARPRTTTITVNTVQGPRGAHGMRAPWPTGGIAGEAGAEFAVFPDGTKVLLTEATHVPPGTNVTSVRRTREILHRHHYPHYANGVGQPIPVHTGGLTVNINAAVIGNRFDVARAVARANRDKTRIMGNR